MRVKVRSREIEADAKPVDGCGYFMKFAHTAAAGIGKGEEIEVNTAKLEVRYVIEFPGGEPEVWLLATPKKAEKTAALPF